MAQALRKLASETFIYGFSTVLARTINFLFVSFYTRLLSKSDYGVVAEFMTYIAVLQVVLFLGLETGCFRFANKEGNSPDKVFSNALFSVFCSCGLFLLATVLFAVPVSEAMGYGGYSNCVMYLGGILFLDGIASILFARLRYEHKAVRFAALKTVKIISETGCNLLLFLVYPAFAASHPDNLMSSFVSPSPDFSYAIFSVFFSCVVCILLFMPELLRLRLCLDRKMRRAMLAYSLPLMVASLPGIVNEFLDRILFRYFDTSSADWRATMGVYQAAVKLAVIMNLFSQMFKYAAEPFFFQQEKEKGSREMYARVQEYFTAFSGLVFLGVVLYVDLFSLILGRDFRSGTDIVPVMLLAYMTTGMLYNVSMWYKLSGQTKMAVYITTAGLAVTALVNILFMPSLSYHASAWAHLASAAAMFALSSWLGQKRYPIPYNWKRIGGTVAVMLAVYGLSRCGDLLLPEDAGIWLRAAAHTPFILIYILACIPILGISFRRFKTIR